MKKYDYFLFDLDGTLLETEELILECFKHSLKLVYNLKVPDEKLVNKIGLPLKDQVKLICLENQLREIPFAEFQAIHMNHQLKIWRKFIKLFPQVRETLTQLQEKNKKLAIVTSRKMPTTELYLKHTKIFDFFPVIITPEKTTQHKPKAEPALKAMEEMKAKKARTLFIGDSIYDMQCAKESGIDSYLIRWNESWNDHKKVIYPTNYQEKNLTKVLQFI